MADIRCTAKQRVGLDVDFATRTIKGFTEITVLPLDPTLRTLRFNCRQCNISRVTINGRAPGQWGYNDPHAKWRLHDTATVNQWGMLRRRIDPLFTSTIGDDELSLTLPNKMKIELEDPSMAGTLVPSRDVRANSARDSPRIDTPGPNATDGPVYATLLVRIDYTIPTIRDGLHFVGSDDDPRYPHAFTTNSFLPGSAACLFPCIDDLWERPPVWDIEITCPRTLGDIGIDIEPYEEPLINGFSKSFLKRKRPKKEDTDFAFQYHGEGSDLEMQVVCSGSCVNEFTNATDPHKKVFHFTIEKPTAPHQIAFAIGPFEKAVLTENRAAEEDEALGRNAVEVVGYCLPGRKEEVENTCLFMQRAIDYMVRNAGHYPYPSFSLAFVDDFPSEIVSSAGLAVCSSRLLFKQDCIDPIYTTTKLLSVALASQWCGVQIIPKAWEDLWLIIGLAHFLAGQFLKNLTGSNEHRFRMKKDAEEICRQDVGRAALSNPLQQLPLDSSDLDFIALKAPVVLFILDRRLTKASSSMGVSRVISKLFLNAFTGDVNSLNLSTAQFIKQCEKVGHQKLDSFFNQWVFRSGYPRFEISQRFNKKKMIVEMIIRQTQDKEVAQRGLSPQNFLRDALNRQADGVKDASPPQVFSGPMTIRIHEADGTPYEHVVQIHEVYAKLEIPYNTKYKRLKRTRRQKERLAAFAGMDINAETQAEDVLLYCLGDVLQSDEDSADWRLTDFTKEEEDKMAQEAFEWIRVDADFEWICTMRLNQPDHMYLSQLQQDRDVAAQYESVLHFKEAKPSHLISTILVRTVMDRRYYYGIRCEAAKALSRCATAELNWIGEFHLQRAFQEFYCFPDSLIPRANDFSDFTSYFVQQSIITGFGEIRDALGKSPLTVQRYLLDIIRYNDNSSNSFSDSFHLANLLRSLGSCLQAGAGQHGMMDMEVDETDTEEREKSKEEIIREIERLQRMDQWMTSYHNVISTTCLDVKDRLIKAKVQKYTPLEFLAYSKEGTSEQLRIKAINCLVQNGAVRDPNLLGYICYIIASDPSSRIRRETFESLMHGIGSIAIGDDVVAGNEAAASNSLTIVEENSAAKRQQEARQNIDAAIRNLKEQLASKPFFREALGPILKSTTINFLDVRKIINLCSLLYDDIQSHIVKVPMRKARAVAVSHEGKGKLRFITNPSTKELVKLRPVDWPHLRPQPIAPPPPPPPPPQAQPSSRSTPQPAVPKLVLKPPALPGSAKPSTPVSRKPSFSPPQPHPTPVAAVSSSTPQPKTILKLKAPTQPPQTPPAPPPKPIIKLKFTAKSGSS
ncbi:hypothetical protein TWF481_007277 [Arthrobotrys musiformis]|uniref:Transcription initiation factor TFIID subunit 2 n=1 Tax=Arthrobotrys musiformis TaxID=47236 RepID=A0AAV9WCY0_9PEZI